MKREDLLKYAFAIIALICVAVGAWGAYTGEASAMTALATAPLVAGAVGGISPERMNELKAKHGTRLFTLRIKIADDEEYNYVVKRPSKDTIMAIAHNKDNITKANDILMKQTVLAGDMDALEDGVVFSAVLKEIGKMTQGAQSFLAKA